ncbi:MAG: hypothetical protein R3C28_12580 [Pirellulaceae bacterium]
MRAATTALLAGQATVWPATFAAAACNGSGPATGQWPWYQFYCEPTMRCEVYV